MKSIILQTAARYLLPLILLFSIFLLLRGHNSPGGGFVGGLTAAAAFALYAFAYDVGLAREALRFSPGGLTGLGLLIAAGSGLLGSLLGGPYLTGRWAILNLPGLGKLGLGTPVLFDLGVYLTVMGMVLGVLFRLAED